MRRTRWATGMGAGLLALLAVPAVAMADGKTLDMFNAGTLPEQVGINSIWVLVAGILVMFMQAGFAFLEIGFSRGKNAGTVIAKILVNFSIAAICFWAVGFAFAFGNGNELIGTSGFFLAGADASSNFALVNVAEGTITLETLWFFQFVFCAVSLAIVWGTTLERVKFGVYVIYAVVFSAFIYPIGAHWIFGGGWLADAVLGAGLRRLDGGPPDRCDRRARRAAAPRRRVGASSARTASRAPSRVTTCRCSVSAC